MGKDKMKNEVLQVVEIQEGNQNCESELGHPNAIHVSGPRNVPSNSTWKDGNYKRKAIARFVQAVYRLEEDRQENRNDENALAPTWWTPFKYKLVKTLIDERDGSIFGAILEWDRAAALAEFVPLGAPRSVLAIRGTLLKCPTIRRDIGDDLRLLTWESRLKGSVRFGVALNALRSISEKYGSSNVLVAGHSLGAGFVLQVGKALAKEAIFVEAHLFNPPSVSLATGFWTVGEKAGKVWKRVRATMMSRENESENGAKLGSKQWVLHLYLNNRDYICRHYIDGGDKENAKPMGAHSGVAKLFEWMHKFLEAHSLEQWWDDDSELQVESYTKSKLMSMQLKSLQCTIFTWQVKTNAEKINMK